MNSKNIKKYLKAKLKDWTEHIDNAEVKKAVEENTIITGGAMVSLLTGERPHDYDVYFRTKEACIEVAKYYVDKWNETHKDKPVSLVWGNLAEQITGADNGSVKCIVKSKGIADEDEEQVSSMSYNFESTEQEDEEMGIISDKEQAEDGGKKKYHPRFITSNAITLSDKIQIVTRFYGEVAEIHKNYDFVHCTCAWNSWDNEVFLPQKALECIINKELYYVGSKYPLCSIKETAQKCTWVSQFIMEYYGCGIGQRIDGPLHTIVTRDRFALITVLGNKYVILDIFLRMLRPEELKLGQGFPADYIIDRDINYRPYPIREQVARIGNSVVPIMAEKLVEANCGYLKVGNRPPSLRLDMSGAQIKFA